DHAFALVPEPWLAPVFAAIWFAGVACFWAAFAALAGDLGLTHATVFAVGLIGVRSAFAGLGSVTLLTPYLYPASLACVGWLVALREALRARAAASGVAAGLAMLVHPQVGLLALLTMAAAMLGTAGWRAAARSTGIALLAGGFALARL